MTFDWLTEIISNSSLIWLSLTLSATERGMWLAAYVAIFLLILTMAITVGVVAWKYFQPKASDLQYIRRHRESLGSSEIRITRISSVSRLWLGGILGLSNWTRMYAVKSVGLAGRAETFNYAVDPIAGVRKVRQGGIWREV